MNEKTAYIIAAGDGSRLVKEGCLYKKPMLPLNGVPMIERLIDILAAENFTEFNIITNEANSDIVEYLSFLSYMKSYNINMIKITTPSSMHSLYELIKNNYNYPFYLCTVDTVFTAKEFRNYVEYCENNASKFDAIIAITGYIDDEKPLYVRTENDRISAFLDQAEDCTKVTSGIYYFNTNIYNLIEQEINKGTQRMRNFQRSLISAGLNVGHYTFEKTLDVDHVSDIIKAEAFLKQEVL